VFIITLVVGACSLAYLFYGVFYVYLHVFVCCWLWFVGLVNYVIVLLLFCVVVICLFAVFCFLFVYCCFCLIIGGCLVVVFMYTFVCVCGVFLFCDLFRVVFGMVTLLWRR